MRNAVTVVYWVVGSVFSSLLAVGVAYACSFAPSAVPTSGVLGLSSQASVPAFAEPGSLLVPRNVAFLVTEQVIIDGDTFVNTVALDLPFSPKTGPFLGVDGLLPAGSLLQADGPEVEVGDFIDEQTPDVPVITGGDLEVHNGDQGCASDSCGDFANLRITLDPSRDDHTPEAHVVYALFVGVAPNQVRDMLEPTELVMLDNGELQSFVDFRFSETDVFVSVAAIDFAANHSERSEPIRVHRGDRGCAVAQAGRAHLTTGLLAILALWVIARPGRRRRVGRGRAGRRGQGGLAASEASGS